MKYIFASCTSSFFSFSHYSTACDPGECKNFLLYRYRCFDWAAVLLIQYWRCADTHVSSRRRDFADKVCGGLNAACAGSPSGHNAARDSSHVLYNEPCPFRLLFRRLLKSISTTKVYKIRGYSSWNAEYVWFAVHTVLVITVMRWPCWLNERISLRFCRFPVT